eukprot:7379010-Prymnesium_polylepis.1
MRDPHDAAKHLDGIILHVLLLLLLRVDGGGQPPASSLEPINELQTSRGLRTVWLRPGRAEHVPDTLLAERVGLTVQRLQCSRGGQAAVSGRECPKKYHAGEAQRCSIRGNR